MTAHCNDSVPMPDAHGMPWCDQCRGWHHDTAPHIGRPRRDIPKSGSRREAIEKLLDAARHLQTIRPDKANSVQAAINYMIMHDGW
jgi:hypothetical protein